MVHIQYVLIITYLNADSAGFDINCFLNVLVYTLLYCISQLCFDATDKSSKSFFHLSVQMFLNVVFSRSSSPCSPCLL
jgi:hypothetical protein